MNVAVLQPSYVPWRGFFHLIQKSDVFVWYDDVQYDKHGWRNRNRVKTPRGTQWITIPVHSKGNTVEHTAINQIRVSWEKSWNESHLGVLKSSYGRTPHFGRYAGMLQEFYSQRPESLADFTIATAERLARELGIEKTKFVRSSALGVDGIKTDRLIALLKELGATHYISGPSARDYIEQDKFDAAGITLEYMVYDYPPYEQLYPPFDPQVSILDLLFMTGSDAPKFIWDR
ncbi:MAG: WbqC family protein [Tepidisphaeraceae bacterium]